MWRLSAPQPLELQPGTARRGAVRGADRPARSSPRPARAAAQRTPPSPGLPVCLSLPRGVTAGGNHGVRSRYTRTLLFHLVSRRGVGKRRVRVGREGLYLNAHLWIWELQSVREGSESAPVRSLGPSPQSCSIYPLSPAIVPSLFFLLRSSTSHASSGTLRTGTFASRTGACVGRRVETRGKE